MKPEAAIAQSHRAVHATALGRAVRVLGDPWTMLILKESFNGVRRFGDFQRHLNIPRQTLSLRLNHLCREQMLYKRFISGSATTFDYAPTAKTFDLQDAMFAVWLWHRANPGDADVLPFDIVHRECGQVIDADYCCTHCGGAVNSSNVAIHRTEPPQFESQGRRRLSRRNDMAITAASEGGGEGMIAASLVGDVACNEILDRLFREPSHLLALSRELDLGPPLLRGRLDKLIALRLVRESRQGRRAVFSVLPRAEAFYPLLLALADWGDRWCNDGEQPPELRIHTCGAPLKARYRCRHCGGWLGPRSVFVKPRVAADRTSIAR